MLNIMTKNYGKKELSAASDTKHSLVTKLVESSALLMGHIVKFGPGYGELFSKVAGLWS